MASSSLEPHLIWPVEAFRFSTPRINAQEVIKQIQNGWEGTGQNLFIGDMQKGFLEEVGLDLGFQEKSEFRLGEKGQEQECRAAFVTPSTTKDRASGPE